MQLHPTVLEYFRTAWAKNHWSTNKVTIIDDKVVVQGYTSCTFHGNSYRAHPNYRKGTGEWYDWATVQFQVGEDTAASTFPSKLLCFFTIKGCPTTERWVVVHSCSEQITQGEEFSVLTEKWLREYKARRGFPANTLFPVFCTVAAETIQNPQFVMENTPGLRESVDSDVDSLTMILAKDREVFWPGSFFGLCSPRDG